MNDTSQENNILIVDDMPDNLTILSQMLTQKGYIVRPALNGKLAIKAIERRHPDLILLDIMMPDMTGYELCEHLKSHVETRDIPVLFISALNEAADKIKAFEAGGVDYITKPFQSEEVLARVETHLKVWNMQQQLQTQNVQLQQEIQVRRETESNLQRAHNELKKAMDDLVKTQTQLVQSEKLAALGRVVAGIAHEIKNPLNFINNFAQLIEDMLHDLQVELGACTATIASEQAGSIERDIDDIIETASKLVHHGQRADTIVQDMLDHSRGGNEQRRLTDLNMLLDEYIELVIQDLKAKNSELSLSIEKAYEPDMGLIDVFPHSLGRVFLNIVQNACYALQKKQMEEEEGFSPELRITTKPLNDQVEIRIRDNGPGIPQHEQDDIFTPFFTTKPPGEGTGLGLSISYDIVVREHQGSMSIQSKEGEFTEFTILLPKHL